VQLKRQFVILLIVFNAGVASFLIQIGLLQSLRNESDALSREQSLTQAWHVWQTLKWNLIRSNPRGQAVAWPTSRKMPGDVHRWQRTPFFTYESGILHEWRAIQRDGGDWHLVALLYDSAAQSELGKLLRCDLHVIPRESIPSAPLSPVSARFSLAGPGNDLVAFLVLSPHSKSAAPGNDPLFQLTAAALICATVTVTLLTYIWFARPVRLILQAMQTNRTETLDKMKNRSGEMAQLAYLVSTSLKQKDLLQQLLQEREELNRNLHDEVIQGLFGLGLVLESLRQSPMKKGSQEAQTLEKRLLHCREQVNETIQRLRHYLESPGETMILTTGLNNQIRDYVSRLSEGGNVDFVIDIPGDLDSVLSPRQCHELFAMVSECLSNAIRHGDPETIIIRATIQHKWLDFEVVDDGFGFDPAVVTEGNGLSNLRNRAEKLRAKVKTQSSPGSGCRIQIHIPLEK